MALQEWLADSPLAKQPPWWIRYALAGLITLFAIGVVSLLWRRLGAIPDPGLILLFTVAATTYLAGGLAGMLSAAIVLFSSFLLFSHPLHPFRYSELDWRQMMAIIVACPVIALMVGSLKEQVDLLRTSTARLDGLADEVRRLEAVKELQFISDQRFRLLTESLPEHAVFGIDVNGRVSHWNHGAELVFGYSDSEILGQNYSRIFTREDLLERKPARLLEQARDSGRAVEEGWRVRRGNGRMRASSTLSALRNSQGVLVGGLMVVRVLSSAAEGRDPYGKA